TGCVAGGDGSRRSYDAGDGHVIANGDAVALRVCGRRHDGAQEVVLYRGNPPITRGKSHRAIRQQVIPIQLGGTLAVVYHRSMEGIRIDVEHRPVLRIRMSLDLRVLGAAPFGTGLVGHGLLYADDVTAPGEAKLLHHTHAPSIAPGKRNQELVPA